MIQVATQRTRDGHGSDVVAGERPRFQWFQWFQWSKEGNSEVIYGYLWFNHGLFMVFHRWALGSTFPPVLEISHNWSRMEISKSVGQAGQRDRT